MTAPELTPDVFTAVADWIMRDGGREQIAELVPQPGMLADDFYARAQELRAQEQEDERLGALVFAASRPGEDFGLAGHGIRQDCIRIGRAVQADTLERQAAEQKGRDPWPPYKQPPLDELKLLGEQLIWHQQNTADGATATGVHALQRVHRLYELRLRDTPLDDEPRF